MTVSSVMSRVMDKILQEAQSLTPEERSRLIELLRGSPRKGVATQAEVVDGVFGKYAHVKTSSEDFCVSKAEEVELENGSRRR